jgi:glycosyltransferase involved in cell wall biosynthesis
MKNEARFIEGCLKAIRNNDYPKDAYEIICVDNGSTDQTVGLAKTLADQVYQIPNQTISYLRNFGAQKAVGAYLAFVDADCIVDPLWLKAASHYFNRQDIVCFGSTPTIPKDATWVQRTWYLHKDMRQDVQPVNWLESMNLFVRKDVFSKVGGFNEFLMTCEDVDLCYRIGENHTILSDKKVRVVHLGEAATLKEFFFKELWRGSSNIKGIMEHGIKLKEMPSILIPLYYLALPLTFLIIWRNKGFKFALVSFFFLLTCPAFFIALYMTQKAGKPDYTLKAFIVYLLYFISRAVALVH